MIGRREFLAAAAATVAGTGTTVAPEDVKVSPAEVTAGMQQLREEGWMPNQRARIAAAAAAKNIRSL